MPEAFLVGHPLRSIVASSSRQKNKMKKNATIRRPGQTRNQPDGQRQNQHMSTSQLLRNLDLDLIRCVSSSMQHYLDIDAAIQAPADRGGPPIHTPISELLSPHRPSCNAAAMYLACGPPPSRDSPMDSANPPARSPEFADTTHPSLRLANPGPPSQPFLRPPSLAPRPDCPPYQGPSVPPLPARTSAALEFSIPFLIPFLDPISRAGQSDLKLGSFIFDRL